jgi:competence protein ComEC
VTAPPAPRSGEAWVTTFDVGQGLGVLVRTAGHALLYDAGPAWGVDADSGSRVVVPALQGAGLSRIDVVVLSHEDKDHIGGALSVMESFEVGELVSSLAPSHPLNALAPQIRRCSANDAWEWDGVRFELLHPAPDAVPARRNNMSCVLRVVAATRSVLITGDIERGAEAQMVALGRAPKTDVLLVPHHGSRTSSTPDFIAAVAPSWVIVPVGYRSRFGHPNAEVLERYRAAGAQLMRTDLDGAVSIRLGSDFGLETERYRRHRYWLQ